MYKVPGTRFQVQGFRYKVSGTRFQVQGFRYKVSGTRFQVISYSSAFIRIYLCSVFSQFLIEPGSRKAAKTLRKFKNNRTLMNTERARLKAESRAFKV